MAWVYILASRKHGTLYVGATEEIERRIWEHRSGATKGFTSRYGVHRLVWMADFPTMTEATAHEWRLKRWRRSWKIQLIERTNPDWDDLFESIL